MKNFKRWECHEKSTWPFQVFKRYNSELESFLVAHRSASKYTYTQLGKEGAKWEDPSSVHLTESKIRKRDYFDNLKDWSTQYNSFHNWVNLNAIVAISSTLEIYLSTVIQLSIDSDPGLLIGASRSVDGSLLLKKNIQNIDTSQYIESCTKGDWSSRISAFSRLFGEAPPTLRNNVSTLEKIRKLRNKVGHAFGRDIDDSRKHGVKQLPPIEKLSVDKATKYFKTTWDIAKSVDCQLLKNHIGSFQHINFYHQLFSKLRQDVHLNVRAMSFKKELGKFEAVTISKQYAKDLVSFYETMCLS